MSASRQRKRNHPVARIKGGWSAAEDAELCRCAPALSPRACAAQRPLVCCTCRRASAPRTRPEGATAPLSPRPTARPPVPRRQGRCTRARWPNCLARATAHPQHHSYRPPAPCAPPGPPLSNRRLVQELGEGNWSMIARALNEAFDRRRPTENGRIGKQCREVGGCRDAAPGWWPQLQGPARRSRQMRRHA